MRAIGLRDSDGLVPRRDAVLRPSDPPTGLRGGSRDYRPLEGRSIVVGITGSVALYRSIDLVRRLRRMGARVLVVMTRDATRFVSPLLFEWAAGSEVILDYKGHPNHIDIAEEADALIIAPATANTIGKIASGIGDTSVSLLAHVFLGSGKPVIIVPAMHLQLYRSPVISGALEKLRGLGVHIVEPVLEEGKAKYPPVEELAWRIDALLSRGMDLAGYRVLVTAGPTREYFDPVRFISNPSTGRMGFYVAGEAAYRGAHTILVHGPSCIHPPRGVDVYSVETTEEMLETCSRLAEKHRPDIVVLAAAPSDYAPKTVYNYKISSETPLSLELYPTPKIALKLRKLLPGSVIVGFAAEPLGRGELVKRAVEKSEKYGFDLIVANRVGAPGTGFGSETNYAVLIGRDGILAEGLFLKRELARIILDNAHAISGKS